MTTFREKLEAEITDIDRKLGLDLYDLWMEWRGQYLNRTEEERQRSFLWETPDTKKHVKHLQTRQRRLKKLLKGTLTPEDIKVGRLYRGRHPKEVLFRGPDDRVVLHISRPYDAAGKNHGMGLDREVQYDSYAVRTGRHFPTVSMEKFLAWASHDVTDEEKANQAVG